VITLRPAAARAVSSLSWLDSRHTFSFAQHYMPDHMGYRALRVINEDVVAPARGFGTHPHQDMEIITYVLDGELEHRDSMGNGSRIRPGDVQRMSAGTGVRHSEMNPSRDAPVHLLQIWILPEKRGLPPSYQQKAFSADERRGRLRLVAAPADRAGREGAVTVHQDCALYASLLGPGQRAAHALAPNRHAWVQVTRGAVTCNGRALAAGDGAAVDDEREVALGGVDDAELLLFDLA
jgi:redox-sensitive bicupin YhaK (pirin superfamily)